MKPHLLKVSVGPHYSFSIRKDKVPYFYNRLHFHPEFELVFIEKGSGTQFIGDSIGRFEAGDMILVGANLTHMWRCDEEYFSKQSKQAEATVIHFHPHFLGQGFFYLPEHRSLLAMLEKAGQGLKIQGGTKSQVKQLLQKLLKSKDEDRVILLLLILQAIAQSNETDIIASKELTLAHSKAETSKLDRIYQYVMDNFHEKITLEKAASLVNISPKSFCRYFKSHTRKTFSAFLIEIRIAHACKLLQQEEKSVYEVCYESGFNNLSNFNRFFKKLTGKTPLEYKKQVKG